MNIRTLLNQIKSDIKTYDFNYIEYFDNTLDWDRTFIKEGNIVMYVYRDYKGSFRGYWSTDYFMETNNTTLIKSINGNMYYNYVESDIYDI